MIKELGYHSRQRHMLQRGTQVETLRFLDFFGRPNGKSRRVTRNKLRGIGMVSSTRRYHNGEETVVAGSSQDGFKVDTPRHCQKNKTTKKKEAEP